MADRNNGREKTLEAILLPIPKDHRETVTKAYYNTAGGDPSCGPIQVATLLSAIAYAILESSPSSKGNGASPGQLKFPTQLDEISASLKSLPTRADLETLQTELSKRSGGADNKELTAFLDEWRVKKANTQKPRKRDLAAYIAKWLVVGAAAVGLGVLLGVWWDESTANARIAADHATSLAYVREIVQNLHSQTHPSPSASPTGSYAGKPGQ